MNVTERSLSACAGSLRQVQAFSIPWALLPSEMRKASGSCESLKSSMDEQLDDHWMSVIFSSTLYLLIDDETSSSTTPFFIQHHFPLQNLAKLLSYVALTHTKPPTR